MDAKLIFIKAEHLISKTDLDNQPSGGWLYCGRSGDLNVELLSDCLERHFHGETVYFVTSRHDSRIESKEGILSLIAATIDEQDFALWSEEFDRVMQFQKIGVFRFGSIIA
jgi:hypothetical protein